MSYNRFAPGNIRHAPGVVCLIAIPQEQGDEIDRMCSGVVVIQHKIEVSQRYTCGCGNSITIPFEYLLTGEQAWDCAGNGLFCGGFISLRGQRITLPKPVEHRMLWQSWLIPLSDPEQYKRVLESEATDEMKEKIMEFASETLKPEDL